MNISVYIREKGWYNIKMRSTIGPVDGKAVRTKLKSQCKELAIILLKIAGMVTFLALAFMYFYVVAFGCIVVGLLMGNKGGGNK